MVSKNKIFFYVANEWLYSKVGSIKEQSYNKYINILNNYIYPYFYKIKINKINNKMVNDYFGILNSLSYSTKKTILFIIKSILYFSYVNSYVKNIIELKITLNKKYNSIEYFTLQEQKKLENYILNNVNTYTIGLLICLYTGLRIGEICGLKWEDIDLDKKVININKTVQRIQNINSYTTKKIISSPKSTSSYRTIPIPNFICFILNDYKNDKDYYLLSNSKMFMEPRCYDRYYKKILKECNIKNIKFHSLRHTFATRSIECGMDIKTLSEILGHTTYHTTLNTYIHSSIDQKRNCINKLVDNIYKIVE